ncbi:phosphoadenosine phosphosulfate reductase [Kroppenstedtia sanguinis]|uniref:Adenosine 5'-phosphosulfate reductase n=1 Tax=Kroppenstedtia sanguinis TaxID=1380684 RepID=A0ABW4C9I1_9BACL
MSNQTDDNYSPQSTGEGSLTSEEIRLASEEFRGKKPWEVLQWGAKRFGKSMTLACSFGYEDVALVHMLHRVAPETDIFYLDTDLLFPETYETRDRLAKVLGKSFIRVRPESSLEEQARLWGEELWKRDPNTCCGIRKVRPLRRFLKNYSVWCSGIRREQSPTRAHTEVVEWDHQFGLLKLNPLAYWSSEEVWDYIKEHDIPYNPMHDRHYPSIGCIPCTRQVRPGEDARAGRWSGMDKTECGLHPSEKQ